MISILHNIFTVLTFINYNFYGGAYKFNFKNLISTKEIFRRNVFLYKASKPMLAEDLIYNIDQINDNRIRFNINLQSRIMSLSIEETTELLYILSKKTNLQADTVNIFIKHALDGNDIKRAASIFKHYFISKLVLPTVRSLNIMMDAYRRSLLIQNLNSNTDATRVISDSLVDNIYFYFQLFDSFHLKPDSYTYSCLMQISRDKSEVLELLSKSNKLINPPILRCAIETLGKLNEPAAAILVAISWASKVNEISLFNIFQSSPTGDALLVSLFQNPATQLKLLEENKYIIHNVSYCCSVPSNISASTSSSLFVDISSSEFLYKDLIERLEGLNAAGAAIELMKYKIKYTNKYPNNSICYSNNNPSSLSSNSADNSFLLKCSSKGYCALFTFLQREIRKLSLLDVNEKINNYHNNSFDIVPVITTDSTDSSDISPPLTGSNNKWQHHYKESMIVSDAVQQLYDLRNCIWERFKTEVVLKAKGIVIANTTTTQSYSKQITITTDTELTSSMSTLLNGRLIDSILRTYLLDIDGARLLWKHQILPLLKLFQFKKQQGTSDSSYFTNDYKESVVKGLEALIFLSGRNMRQDIALEIANTVNTRKFLLFNTTATNNSILNKSGSNTNPSDRRHSMHNIHNNNSSYSQYCYSLYRSYCYGKKLYLESYQLKKTRKRDVVSDSSSFLKLSQYYQQLLLPTVKVNEFLSQGLENSIQLQLGILTSTQTVVTNTHPVTHSLTSTTHGSSSGNSSNTRIDRIRIKF